jgi:putative inorganic carbon (hco3(-)) transporter
MLRNIFVAIIILIGIRFSLSAPFYALLFYIWNAYFRPEQWLWTDWVSSLRISLLVGSFLLVAVVFAEGRLRFSRRLLVFFLFGVHCIVSMLMSAYLSDAWPFMQEFLKVLIISYLITTMVDDLWKFRLTLLVMAFSLGLEQAKQGWGNILLTPGMPNGNGSPFLGDNNGVAIGMLMLLPIFVALLQTSGKLWERHIHRVFAIGVAVRAIVTYSRGGFLSAAALAGYYLVLSPRRVRSAIGIAVICAVVVSIMPNEFWDRMNSINASEEERDESTQGRLHTWAVGLQMGQDNPIFGVGFHSYQYAYDRYDFLAGAYGTGRAAHSTWIGVLGDLGFVGLALWIAMLFQSLYLSFRLRRTPKSVQRGAEIRIYATALQASILSFAFGSTFLHMQYNEMVWHFLALTIALEGIANRAAADSPPTVEERPAFIASPHAAMVATAPRAAARVSAALPRR